MGSFGEDDGAGGFQSLDYGGVFGGDVVFAESTSECGGDSGGFYLVFDQDWKAVEGASLFFGECL